MTVMLSSFAPLRVNSAKQLSAERDRPFAAAQGDKQGPSIGNNLRKSPAPSVGATIKVAPTDGAGLLSLFMASVDAYCPLDSAPLYTQG